MKYLETEHEKKSFVITVIIYTVILLLCFFLGMTYMDPPPENGIAINFGTTEFGQGDVQPMEDVRMAPQQAQSAAEATPQADEVATQDVDDAPVVNKEKPQKETPKQDVTPKPQPKPTPSKNTMDALNSVLNGPKTDGKSDQGQGDDNKPGDAGRRDGDRNGDGDGDGKGLGRGTGVGNYQLAGRKPVATPKPGGCNEEGTVAVQITVDNSGRVISVATDRGTIASPCLINQAKQAALKTKFEPGDAEKQIGKIIYNFKLSE
ncbi:energy transducer TonB [Flavobacterium sp. J372]|uniref:energy transducer TonB family protein n=1 Tax=Flavobacterium sp. J372 TaxID=2898436 RepID=UPI00215141E6|nr:energy transducer TonB [Flavobacterium sp. J372]MCR5861954.1 energy transducer TonB [Flavobacterium sp. J372]